MMSIMRVYDSEPMSLLFSRSVEYQRISWEALKKSINGLVNKVNVSNIEFIVREVFQENIVRGR